MKKILLSFFIGIMLIACSQKTVSVREVWTKEQANEWYQQWGWLRGCDFIPSTAINQLEMWQADTFDPVTIDRELGWAEDIGMNCMRVYLHHWFGKRIRKVLRNVLMNTLLLPTSIISLPSLSFWMIAGILLIRQENNRNHNREYIIRDGRVIREICIIKVIRQ